MWWRVAREWNGETCFIVAGGPSLALQNLNSLNGARVIVINSSWPRVPFADVLFFGDGRWFAHYGEAALAGFGGRLATVATEVAHPRVLHLRRSRPPGLAIEPDTVMIRRTSVSAAINLAVHFGAVRICLLGVDNCLDPKGRAYHHAPHPWDMRHGAFQEQAEDLASIVPPPGVTLVNASPVSSLSFWPKVELTDETAALHQGYAWPRGQSASARTDQTVAI